MKKKFFITARFSSVSVKAIPRSLNMLFFAISRPVAALSREINSFGLKWLESIRSISFESLPLSPRLGFDHSGTDLPEHGQKIFLHGHAESLH